MLIRTGVSYAEGVPGMTGSSFGVGVVLTLAACPEPGSLFLPVQSFFLEVLFFTGPVFLLGVLFLVDAPFLVVFLRTSLSTALFFEAAVAALVDALVETISDRHVKKLFFGR